MLGWIASHVTTEIQTGKEKRFFPTAFLKLLDQRHSDYWIDFFSHLIFIVYPD